jgi:hypothetical protein
MAPPEEVWDLMTAKPSPSPLEGERCLPVDRGGGYNDLFFRKRSSTLIIASPIVTGPRLKSSAIYSDINRSKGRHSRESGNPERCPRENGEPE